MTKIQVLSLVSEHSMQMEELSIRKVTYFLLTQSCYGFFLSSNPSETNLAEIYAVFVLCCLKHWNPMSYLQTQILDYD